MSSRLLVALLAGCGILAAWPTGWWLSASAFGRTDAPWVDTLPATGVTVPLGLALAALVLVRHGMALNAQRQEQAAEEADARMRAVAAQLAAAGAPTSGAPATAGAYTAPTASARTATVSASGATMVAAPSAVAPAAEATAEMPAASSKKSKKKQSKLVEKGKRRAQAIAKRELRRSTRGWRI